MFLIGGICFFIALVMWVYEKLFVYPDDVCYLCGSEYIGEHIDSSVWCKTCGQKLFDKKGVRVN